MREYAEIMDTFKNPIEKQSNFYDEVPKEEEITKKVNHDENLVPGTSKDSFVKGDFQNVDDPYSVVRKSKNVKVEQI